MRRIVWMLALGAIATAAWSYSQPQPELPSDREPARIVPATGYTLALIWMPEQCRTTGEGVEPRAASECADPAIRSRFTLHGLWPDGTGYEKWPQYCRPADILGRREIAIGFPLTPSAQLLQHEWAKHGVCVAPDAASYFTIERRLFERLRFPEMSALAARTDLTVSDFSRAFAAANPGMMPDMVRLNASHSGSLKEVWLCLDLDRRPRACPAGAGGAPPDQPIKVQAAF